MIPFSTIPQVVGGTVAVADRKEFTIPASGPLRMQQLAALVTDAGSHATFVLTIEGFVSGEWVSLAGSSLNPNLPTGVTADENGLAIPGAIAVVGLALTFDTNFPKFRFGLAGDNAAADGAGFVQPTQTRG